MMRFISRHKISSVIVLMSVLSSTVFVAGYNYIVDQQVEAHVQAAKQDDEFIKKQLAEVQKEKEAARILAAKKQAAQKRKDAAERKVAEATTQKDTANKSSSDNAIAQHRNPALIDVIVNKTHPMIPRSFAPATSTVSCAGNGSTTISTKATNDFAKLCNAAKKASEPLSTSSSYRSYATQVSTYNYWVAQDGKAKADTYSARPGYSEHQTGLSVDFQVPGGASLDEFTGTSQQKWLAKNAWKYGWVQRYTSANSAETGYIAESWHYRYVGRDVSSKYIATHASSLERYWGISGGDYK